MIKKGAILYLGGDPVYAQLFGLKFKLPIYGYTEHNRSLGFLYKKTFFKHTDGNLMYTKVEQFLKSNESNDDITIAENILFFTGSRPQHFEHLFPLFCNTIQLLRKNNPNIKPIISISPFISNQLYTKVTSASDVEGITITRSTDSLKLMNRSKLLITIPGTNTAESMFLNLPTLVFIPTNYPELIIFDGLLGIVGAIPIVGKVLKRIAVHYLSSKPGFYAHPNRISNELIFPEFIGIMTPELIASHISNYINNPDKLIAIKRKLQKIYKTHSVSSKIINTIFKNHSKI